MTKLLSIYTNNKNDETEAYFSDKKYFYRLKRIVDVAISMFKWMVYFKRRLREQKHNLHFTRSHTYKNTLV